MDDAVNLAGAGLWRRKVSVVRVQGAGLSTSRQGRRLDCPIPLGRRISENSVGKASVSAVLYQREAELVRCGAVKSPLDSKPSSNFAFANRPVPVLVRIRTQTEIPAKT